MFLQKQLNYSTQTRMELAWKTFITEKCGKNIPRGINSPFDSAKRYFQPCVLFSPDRRSLNLLNRNHGDCLHHQTGGHLRQKPTPYSVPWIINLGLASTCDIFYIFPKLLIIQFSISIYFVIQINTKKIFMNMIFETII